MATPRTVQIERYVRLGDSVYGFDGQRWRVRHINAYRVGADDYRTQYSYAIPRLPQKGRIESCLDRGSAEEITEDEAGKPGAYCFPRDHE